ncbi:MAG TPA: CARDB domain-containing protein [Hyphomicrobiaceae bacterium]|nr:CARDB domain-containing protein [Hyphomicrobiaceae bacterium]
MTCIERNRSRIAAIATITSALAAAAILGLPRTALGKELPDLVISEAKLRATGNCGLTEPVIVGDVYVQNIGKARAQIFTTKDMVRSRVRGMSRLKGASKFVNSLKPGELHKIAIRLGTGSRLTVSGEVIVDIEVDPLNVIKESDEANNRVSARVTLNCK